MLAKATCGVRPDGNNLRPRRWRWRLSVKNPSVEGSTFLDHVLSCDLTFSKTKNCPKCRAQIGSEVDRDFCHFPQEETAILTLTHTPLLLCSTRSRHPPCHFFIYLHTKESLHQHVLTVLDPSLIRHAIALPRCRFTPTCAQYFKTPREPACVRSQSHQPKTTSLSSRSCSSTASFTACRAARRPAPTPSLIPQPALQHADSGSISNSDPMTDPFSRR